MRLEFDLQHRFSGQPPFALALQGQIPTGECLALFGPSGAGKTTLLRCLAGLERPQKGRILADKELWLDSAQGIWLPPERRGVAMAFQEPVLFPPLTVEGHLHYAGLGTEEAQALLAQGGMADLRDRKPAALSGGQAQRLALLTAWAARPRLLLLDEPFRALDRTTRREMWQLLTRLRADRPLTTLLVSHDPEEVARLADRVWMMQDGGVLREDRPQGIWGAETEGTEVEVIRLEDGGAWAWGGGRMWWLPADPYGRLELGQSLQI